MDSGNKGNRAAFASHRRKLEVVLEPVEQAAKLFEQSRILCSVPESMALGELGLRE